MAKVYYSDPLVSWYALTIINEKALGFQKVTTLLDILCFDGNTTPRTWKAGELGPFSTLISLKCQILDQNVQGTIDNTRPLTFGPVKPAPPTFNVLTIRDPPSTPTPANKRPRQESPGGKSDGPSPPRPEDELSDEDLDGIPDSIPNNIPDPRTPTETLIVDLMTTYQFGPINENTSKHVKFRARTDGGIPFGNAEDPNFREVVIFEAKRAQRLGARIVTIQGQRSMEHAAYIWKRHEMEKNQKRDGSKEYHTFMIALDSLDFSISIGTYDDNYLDYIFDGGNEKIVPPNDELKHFLHIQEFGPFSVEDRRSMEVFTQIITSLIIWQVEGLQEGTRPDKIC
ncbi:hypothetical protein FQN57_005860 [Myotisia sp. PD_48]|nr:hypothetical protein FQN57_005860 [Myotisia sp. PD_48]